MISIQPTIHSVRRAFGLPLPELEAEAIDRWVIAPAERRYIAPARFLPGQLDLIRPTEFASVPDVERSELPSVADVVRNFQGDYETIEGATLGFRLRDVNLVDGVLYASRAVQHLRRRRRRWPAYMVPTEVRTGVIYESWTGNRWFGDWLKDDCLTYRLAERFGQPVTTVTTPNGHVPDYEALLHMRPHRINHTHFEELILFHDRSHNGNKEARGDELRQKLVAGVPSTQHPGVFLLRGSSGMQRILINELAIAERLASERGFRVLDASTSSVADIVDVCAGARVVAGVEGGHLVHGLMAMPPNAVLFAIQPPTRVVSVLKATTDRQGQVYSFAVATGDHCRFSISWDVVDRTLDLALQSAPSRRLA
jgi:hypothetical protein